MPTPKAGYFLKDGTKVPGTTTVIGRFKDSGGLLHWAFKQGKEGKARLYDEAEKAADIGTCAHGMVEGRIKGASDAEISKYVAETLKDPAMIEQAVSAFKAYEKWAAQTAVRVVEQEIQLVSEKYRYGGTPDAIGLIGNELCLLDWKTSNSVYQDYLIQLAAYRNLWEENFPDRPITGGFHLLRFAKSHGDFAHHYFANLDNAWRAFVLMRELYDIDKELKKRAA
jgi:hypothetical protein